MNLQQFKPTLKVIHVYSQFPNTPGSTMILYMSLVLINFYLLLPFLQTSSQTFSLSTQLLSFQFGCLESHNIFKHLIYYITDRHFLQNLFLLLPYTSKCDEELVHTKITSITIIKLCPEFIEDLTSLLDMATSLRQQLQRHQFKTP